MVTKSPPASGSKSQSIDEILTIPKAAAKAKKTTVGLTNTAQHVSESPFPESPFLHQLCDKKAAREEKQKPKMKSKAKPRGKKMNSKRKVRSPRLIVQQLLVWLPVLKHMLKQRLTLEKMGQKKNVQCKMIKKEVTSVSARGVCEVKYGAEFESKYGFCVAILKLGIIPLV